jgi:hypothetical protein
MAYEGLETIRRGNTAACIEDIFKIHFPKALRVLDVTFGAGRFWKWDHNLDVHGIDIDPPVEDSRVTVGDYRDIPHGPNTFDVLCFDPPFIFSRGLRAVIGTKRFFMGAEAVNYEGRRWSKDALNMPKGPADLLSHVARIFEQRHIATQGLILKGQDLVVSKNVDWWSFNVFNLGKEMGLGEPTDILIQHSPAHRMRDPRWKNQYKFRRAHCFYIIYKWSDTQAASQVEVPNLPLVDHS